MRRLYGVLVLGLVGGLAACSGSNTTVELTTDGRSDADVAGQGDADNPAEVVLDARTDELPTELPFADVLADLGPACPPGSGCFLEPCSQNSDCLSGWCVDHMGDQVCSQACEEECPAGWSCSQIMGTGPDVVWLCVSPYPKT
ncbi:MAG: hypothetical protein FJ109_11740, partial [Deltaproteobacteria bacterium]|nr:hypothetical protein [Deltaproteobacteria bacterium]